MALASYQSHRRLYGLVALIVGYLGHLVGSLLLPEWRFVSIVFWFMALFGGALFCAETLKRMRLPRSARS